jgi:hypothetical protein
MSIATASTLNTSTAAISLATSAVTPAMASSSSAPVATMLRGGVTLFIPAHAPSASQPNTTAISATGDSTSVWLPAAVEVGSARVPTPGVAHIPGSATADIVLPSTTAMSTKRSFAPAISIVCALPPTCRRAPTPTAEISTISAMISGTSPHLSIQMNRSAGRYRPTARPTATMFSSITMVTSFARPSMAGRRVTRINGGRALPLNARK